LPPHFCFWVPTRFPEGGEGRKKEKERNREKGGQSSPDELFNTLTFAFFPRSVGKEKRKEKKKKKREEGEGEREARRERLRRP